MNNKVLSQLASLGFSKEQVFSMALEMIVALPVLPKKQAGAMTFDEYLAFEKGRMFGLQEAAKLAHCALSTEAK